VWQQMLCVMHARWALTKQTEALLSVLRVQLTRQRWLLQVLMQATAHAVSAFLQVMLVDSYLRKSADAQSVLQITMEHTMTEWHVQKTQTPKKQACASVSQGYHKVGTQSYTDVPICSACAAGMYWIEEQCVSCPEYSSTAAPGALSVAECACVAGYFMQEEKCKQCPADLFQSTLGGACTVCPLNAISAPGSDSQTDCFCKACFSGAD